MSDVQWLFVVLAGLYAWECFCWVRRGGVAFNTWLGRRWRTWHPAALAGNHSGGFVPAAPFPPLGTLFVTNQPSLSLSPDGVLAFVATNVNPGWRPAQSGRFVKWSDLGLVRARGKKVMAQGKLLVATATPGLARYWSLELNRLATLKTDERPEAIARLAQAAFDAKHIEVRLAAWKQCSRVIRWLVNFLVVYIFVLAPLLIWLLGFRLSWLGLLLGLLTLTIAIGTLFARAHRRLYPEAQDERFTQTLTIALAPTSAMRALDALSRPLLETTHPLAAARILLTEGAFNRFARRLMLDLRFPARPTSPDETPEAVTTEQFFRKTMLAAAENFLTQQGVKLEELCRPPARGDDSVRAYCPRCEAQFTSVTGCCADCGGLGLVAFAP